MEKKTTMLVAIVAVIVILLAAVGALYATGNLGGGGDENYTVSFVDGDNELSTLDVKDNSLVKQPADPVKDGYIFAGWYADSALTK
uniref:InlB B-repeat-containing protein n=1 Tax=Candidatus Methanomassiliicoccus intestinalis TaxID=1406512 RepID=UPI0037DC36ED